VCGIDEKDEGTTMVFYTCLLLASRSGGAIPPFPRAQYSVATKSCLLATAELASLVADDTRIDAGDRLDDVREWNLRRPVTL
jgi:hypothetical protein